MTDNAIILGASGGAKILIDYLNSVYSNIIILDDDSQKHLSSFLGCEVKGAINTLSSFSSKLYEVFIGVGSTGNLSNRINIYNKVKMLGYKTPIFKSPSSIISSNSNLKSGSVFFPGCIVNSNVYIGENTLINTGAVIEHDCIIQNNCFISPNVTICGNVTIKQNTFIGAGSTIIGNVTIGENVTLGAGSVVIRDIPDNVITYGNPSHKNIKSK